MIRNHSGWLTGPGWPGSQNIGWKLVGILGVSLAVTACDPGTPSGQTDYGVGGAAAPLTQAEFDSLSPQAQYQVASKLYGTLFRGIPADEFFDLSGGTEQLVVARKNFINDTRARLSTNLQLEELSEYDKAIDGLDEDFSNPDPDLARYRFDDSSNLESNERPRQIPLARIKDYPISRDLYVTWMAYFLANTVMYSPAEEMESTDMQDVQRMYRFLFNNINDGASIRQMVRSNLASLARWRVARTAQNAALEAFENYLGLFAVGAPPEDASPEVLAEYEKFKQQFPLIASLPQSIENAGEACRDLFLTRASDDYLIGQTDFPNTKPLLILEDSFVTNCSDFYDVVAGHSLVIPRAVEVIINYFMPGEDAKEARLAVSGAIAASNPETYEDIITAILFSREYLLNTQRPRSFEENFLPKLDTLKWDVKSNISNLNRDIFLRMASSEGTRLYLGGMSWYAMALKIGRLPNVPLDALSFANYHRALRETLLTDSASWRGSINEAGDGFILDEDGELLESVESMTANQFLDYLFLSTLHRKPSASERSGLMSFLVDVKNYTDTVTILGVDHEEIHSYEYDEFAEVVLDYISRLPELYYFTSVSQD